DERSTARRPQGGQAAGPGNESDARRDGPDFASGGDSGGCIGDRRRRGAIDCGIGVNGFRAEVNTIKVTNKESNEPLNLLTKQAKHGDPIAKLLLKQINAKQAAKAADAAKPAGVAATDEDSETQETSGKSETSEKGEAASASESGAESAGPAEAGKGELVDQRA
ncbi:MAG TPA: hypothetical protein VFC46_12910, partial [Humisphaera sp.]|nr:hypothetical protein [Humisphaera sp.]